MGSDRPDVIFEFPGGNIIDLDVPYDATGMANQVIAFGSGNGDEAGTVVTRDDLGSQAQFRLRQKLITVNGSDDIDGTVTDVANNELAAWAFPFELPSITVNGNIPPFVTDYHLGDRIKVKLGGYSSISHINGLYRIEKIDLTIDDNDNEKTKLYLSQE